MCSAFPAGDRCRAWIVLGGLLAATVGVLRPAVASDAGLAASTDLAIESVGDIPFTGTLMGQTQTQTQATDLMDPSSSSSAGRILGAGSVQARLAAPAEPIVSRWFPQDPGRDQLVVVPLPAPMWATIGGLGMVFVMGGRPRSGRANGCC